MEFEHLISNVRVSRNVAVRCLYMYLLLDAYNGDGEDGCGAPLPRIAPTLAARCWMPTFLISWLALIRPGAAPSKPCEKNLSTGQLERRRRTKEETHAPRAFGESEATHHMKASVITASPPSRHTLTSIFQKPRLCGLRKTTPAASRWSLFRCSKSEYETPGHCMLCSRRVRLFDAGRKGTGKAYSAGCTLCTYKCRSKKGVLIAWSSTSFCCLFLSHQNQSTRVWLLASPPPSAYEQRHRLQLGVHNLPGGDVQGPPRLNQAVSG